jgi:hypothetical protein
LSYVSPMYPEPNYSPLLPGAADGLSAVRCIYFDGLRNLGIETAWTLATKIFDACGTEPASVSYAERGQDARRIKPETFQRRLNALQVDSIEVAGPANDEISQVYEASTYVGMDLATDRSALFFYSDKLPYCSLADWVATDPLKSIGNTTAYAFDYALPFSPTAYFWGLEYKPNRKVLGEVTPFAGARLECWRDNQRRGLHPSQGYLRDLYQQNLLGEVHLSRRVEGMTLAEWIPKCGGGTLQAVAGWWLWSLDSEDIPRSRRILDQAGLLLSGRSLLPS